MSTTLSTTTHAAELQKRAEGLLRRLRERSDLTDELRRIPDETVADLRDAGIITCTRPQRFGGPGLGIDVACELAMTVGRGCGSTSWMTGQWAGHNFMVGWFPLKAQEEYWATSEGLSSTANALVQYDGEEVEGGVRMSGRFKFSSGIDHARWLLLAAPVGFCLMPREDFDVVDDWFVAGLKGTGSKSVVFEDVFVPVHRMIPTAALAAGAYPGVGDPAGAYERLPMHLALNPLILSEVVGMAQGAVEIFEERARTRRDPHTREPAIERPGNQLAFAEASAAVDAARGILRATLVTLRGWSDAAMSGVTIEDRAQVRRDMNFAARLCVQAVDRLVEVGDSSAIYEENLLHRWARDVRVGALQWSLHWDEPAMQYSRVRWGLEPQTRLV
jgi:alkylation response protein AidB-like acyl-CoA dehydrogenase